MSKRYHTLIYHRCLKLCFKNLTCIDFLDISYNETNLSPLKNEHHSFIILIWGKKDLVQLCSKELWAQVAGQATGTRFRNQGTVKDILGLDQEAFHCHKIRRGGILAYIKGWTPTP